VSALRPLVDDRARAAVDAIDLPISVTIAVRDRDARLLDFRLELVNLAAARWAGLDRVAIVGRLATELMPGLRPAGLFDELDRVVTTGRPFRQTGHYDGNVEDGRAFSAIFDLLAVRHGDGCLSAWLEQPEGRGPALDVEAAVERARAAVPLVRLEASALRMGLATT
jgi:PAS domain-containing protein